MDSCGYPHCDHQKVEMTKPPFKEASSTLLLLSRSKAVETDYIIYNARMHVRRAIIYDE